MFFCESSTGYLGWTPPDNTERSVLECRRTPNRERRRRAGLLALGAESRSAAQSRDSRGRWWPLRRAPISNETMACHDLPESSATQGLGRPDHAAEALIPGETMMMNGHRKSPLAAPPIMMARNLTRGTAEVHQRCTSAKHCRKSHPVSVILPIHRAAADTPLPAALQPAALQPAALQRATFQRATFQRATFQPATLQPAALSPATLRPPHR